MTEKFHSTFTVCSEPRKLGFHFILPGLGVRPTAGKGPYWCRALLYQQMSARGKL